MQRTVQLESPGSLITFLSISHTVSKNAWNHLRGKNGRIHDLRE